MFVKIIWMEDKKEQHETTYQCHSVTWHTPHREDAKPYLSMDGTGFGSVDVVFDNSQAYVYLMNDNGKTIDSRFIE